MMKRQQKVKKTLLQKLRKKIHSLTAPKRAPRKRTKRRKTVNPSTSPAAAGSKELHQIENELSRKMTEDMQKMKQEMEQTLLKQLTTKAAKSDAASSKSSNPSRHDKKPARKASPKQPERLVRSADYSFLKVLFLSDEQEKKVVVGYEVIDTGSQEAWGIGVHEGARLCRAKKIADTKLKSRKVDQERQYYLVHPNDETLYYSDDYAKEALKRGRIAVSRYTAELAEAVQYAVELGYGGPKKKRRTK
jgi:hypothetical protein